MWGPIGGRGGGPECGDHREPWVGGGGGWGVDLSVGTTGGPIGGGGT